MDRQTCLARPVPSPPSRTRTPWIAVTGAELRTPFLYFPCTHWVFGACLLLLASLQMIGWKEAGNRLIQRDKCWENHTPITPFNNNWGEAEEESREQHSRSGENLRVCPRHLKPSAESRQCNPPRRSPADKPAGASDAVNLILFPSKVCHYLRNQDRTLNKMPRAIW